MSIVTCAGEMELISGRKAFQRSMKEGIELLHAIQECIFGKGNRHSVG